MENFESGNRQLHTIYGSVLRRYTFSKVDAHKAKRAEHWFADSRKGKWQHPCLLRYKDLRDKEKGTEPLMLFPGTRVYAGGTSQACSKCGRNPLRALRGLEKKGTASLAANEKGEVNIGDGEDSGVLLLREKGSELQPAEKKKLVRRKERPRLEDYRPLAQGSYEIGRLRELVRFHQRRPPHSKLSPDTSQSRYFCLYADCGYESHADENAAINIGRRFFERIAWERSKEKRESLDTGAID